MTGTPHDHLFRAVFRDPFHAAGWLRSVLPTPLVAAIDWSTLRALSTHVPAPGLRAYTADLVFVVSLRVGGLPLLLLVEHKSGSTVITITQLLRYAVHLRRAQRHDHHGQEPLVVPIVLHHGPEPPRMLAAAPLATLPPHLAELLTPMQPTLQCLVDDLSRADETALRRPGLTALAQLTLLALRTLPDLAPNGVVPAIHRWGDLLRAVERQPGPIAGEDALDAFACYVVEVTDVPLEDLDMAFADNLHDPKETIMTTAQRLRAEGHARGRREGRTEGRTEGRAEMLLRQLRRRFGELPATIHERLQTATIEQLDQWAERILVAAGLDDVFAG